MKKIVITNRNIPVLADFEKETVSTVETESVYGIIDRMLIAPDNCEVRYKCEGKEVVKKADKGDLILLFYAHKEWVKEPVAVIKNADVKKNMVSLMAKRAADKAADETIASCELKCCDCAA
jgi:hypothetical protein